MAVFLIIVAIIVIIVILYSKKNTNVSSKVRTNTISCTFRSNGSYSSILNGLEQDIHYIAKNTYGHGKISVVVSVRKINASYCKVSGSFLADVGFNGVLFRGGYVFNGSDMVRFETESATGFTTIEDVKREMLLQFNWHDLPVNDSKFTVIKHGDYTTTPFISFNFVV